jgi:APA family basic amino acid/polyamine antiporter
MAREKVFPTILEKIHFKTKTPWIAIIVIMIASIIFTLVGDIVIVANITVFAIVITFAAVNLAVIVLRYTEPNIERKFKVPINVGKFPILPLFGVGISIYMTFQFEIEVVLVGISIIGIGAAFYSISKKFIQIRGT